MMRYLQSLIRNARPLRLAGRLAAGALVLAGMACSDVSGPGDGTDPPQEHHLLFLSARDGAVDQSGRPMREIYRISADGTELENLTGEPARLYDHLSLSPDGGRVLFSSSRDGCDVWVMNVDGTGLSRLTNRTPGSREDGCNAWPRWSPDAGRIAFVSNRSGGAYHVYVMDADGENVLKVSGALDDVMADYNQVWVVGWSPDGRVVFETGGPVDGEWQREVHTVEADGSDLRPLFDRINDHSPAWSPDGSRIVFIREQDGKRTLHAMNADGSNVRALTAHAGDDWLPGLSPTGTSFEYNPWSPDGTRIAFERDAVDQWGVHLIDADGSGLQRLTVSPASHFNGWSPDGERIALTQQVSYGHNDVFVIDADGTNLVNVTDSPGPDGPAVWVPGG